MADPASTAKPEPVATDPWKRVEHVPCLLTIELPITAFRGADLVRLTPGQVLSTRVTAGQDVPLRVNGELIAWTEFEAVRDRMAVRITDFAE